jgi:hypothetical protein
LFLTFNAHHEAIRFVLPRHDWSQSWETVLDTSRTDWGRHVVVEGWGYLLPARSVAVFRMGGRAE